MNRIAGNIAPIHALKFTNPSLFAMIWGMYDLMNFDFDKPSDLFEMGDGSYFFVNLNPMSAWREEYRGEAAGCFGVLLMTAKKANFFGCHFKHSNNVLGGIPDRVLLTAVKRNWNPAPHGHPCPPLALQTLFDFRSNNHYVMPIRLGVKS